MSKLDPTLMINRLVVAETAGYDAIQMPTTPVGIGRVVAYCDAPTFEIERLDGSRFSWRADLCRRPTADDLEAEILGTNKQPVGGSAETGEALTEWGRNQRIREERGQS